MYKIGDKIGIEELETVSKGIVLKALKVIESSGNLWASRIIEGKDKDTFEDLKQNVIVKLIENDYIISNDCYRIVNKTLYNIKKENIKNIEIVVNENSNISNLDYESYIQYVKQETNIFESTKQKKEFLLKELRLTEKQLEILNIYSSVNSMSKTAEILGIEKSSVQTTIERIREKTKKLIYNVEF